MGLSASQGSARRDASAVCCSAREKHGLEDPHFPRIAPQFLLHECPVEIEAAESVAFAPMHQREASTARRVALANSREVHVYRVTNADASPSCVPALVLTHVLFAEPTQRVERVLFCDDESSKSLAVLLGPAPGCEGEHLVRVWNCAESGCPDAEPVERRRAEPGEEVWAIRCALSGHAAAATLTGHAAPISCMATKGQYFFTADTAGICKVFHKSKNFQERQSALLHDGGVASLAPDRLCLYSVGGRGNEVRVWSLPDLKRVLEIDMSLPPQLLRGAECPQSARGDGGACCSAREDKMPPTRFVAPAPQMPDPASPGSSRQVFKVNLVRRPSSRWCGNAGSARRHPEANLRPRGWLFAAGVLRDGSQPPEEGGLGVLMEWSLGEDKPVCRSARIAHDSPVVLLEYGPYDNGPVITASADGMMRIWEPDLLKGLQLAQQLDLACLGGPLGGGVSGPALAVEQPRSLYVAARDRRLLVWRRQ